MNNNKLKVVISGYYGFNNFGDEAVLSVLINSLKDCGVNDITVFSKNPEHTAKTYQVKSSGTFDLCGLFLNIFKSNVLFSGGGSLLQDSTSLKSLVYYLGVILVALLLRKKVIIFAQGIGPINNKIFQKITAFILKQCTYVTVRDEKSYSLLKNWGLSPNLVSDPVWNLKLKMKYSHRGIGIQLRKWPFVTEDFLQKFAHHIAENYADKIIFIYALQETLDLDVCNRLEEILKEINPDLHTHVVTNRATFEIVGAFSHLDELIAMRYHACLLGLKYGVKVLPIVYDQKVEKLADEFDIKQRIYFDNDEDFGSKIKNLRYENYHINNDKLNDKYFDFKPFEKIIFSL